MATFSSVTRTHILQAIAEYDRRGHDDFLAAYGFASSGDYTLVHEGNSYDSKAILGVAHRHATGRLATPEEFGSGMDGAVSILRRRGFEVTEPAPPSRGAPRTPVARTPVPRTSRPIKSDAARVTALRDAPNAICPTCSMVLPSTKVCDHCS